MTYQLIHDETQVQKFLNLIPDLGPNEKLYGCLFARKKYDPELIKSNDKTQLSRFLSSKELFIPRLKQLEVKEGAYSLKNRTVRNESLVVYAMPNPRDMVQASWATIERLQKCIKHKAERFNPVQETISAAQKSKGNQIYVTLDLDNKDMLAKLLKVMCLNEAQHLDKQYYVIETRGGYHILVNKFIFKDVKDCRPIDWYKRIKELGVDNIGDMLSPVPGTYQGGFPVKFINPWS